MFDVTVEPAAAAADVPGAGSSSFAENCRCVKRAGETSVVIVHTRTHTHTHTRQASAHTNTRTLRSQIPASTRRYWGPGEHVRKLGGKTSHASHVLRAVCELKLLATRGTCVCVCVCVRARVILFWSVGVRASVCWVSSFDAAHVQLSLHLVRQACSQLFLRRCPPTPNVRVHRGGAHTRECSSNVFVGICAQV